MSEKLRVQQLAKENWRAYFDARATATTLWQEIVCLRTPACLVYVIALHVYWIFFSKLNLPLLSLVVVNATIFIVVRGLLKSLHAEQWEKLVATLRKVSPTLQKQPWQVELRDTTELASLVSSAQLNALHVWDFVMYNTHASRPKVMAVTVSSCLLASYLFSLMSNTTTAFVFLEFIILFPFVERLAIYQKHKPAATAVLIRIYEHASTLMGKVGAWLPIRSIVVAGDARRPVAPEATEGSSYHAEEPHQQTQHTQPTPPQSFGLRQRVVASSSTAPTTTTTTSTSSTTPRFQPLKGSGDTVTSDGIIDSEDDDDFDNSPPTPRISAGLTSLDDQLVAVTPVQSSSSRSTGSGNVTELPSVYRARPHVSRLGAANRDLIDIEGNAAMDAELLKSEYSNAVYNVKPAEEGFETVDRIDAYPEEDPETQNISSF